ncbi:MAG: transcription initiation factor IIB family protein [Candidatus Thorarchaeota archaeon]
MKAYNVMTERCCECGNSTILYDESRGDVICDNCGLVIQQHIHSRRQEWRAFSREEEQLKSRVGIPSYGLDKKLTKTIIKKESRDSFGTSLSPRSRAKYARLSNVNGRIYDKKSRKLKNALTELKRIRSHLNFSKDVSEAAIYLYQLALDKDMIKGRSVIGMISAAIYLACRKKRAPITLKEIAEVAGISSKDLGRGIRVFLQNMSIQTMSHDPIILINRLSEKLGLTMYTQKVAVEILQAAKEKHATIGKVPMSLAASAIYIATIKTGERRTQQQISNSSGITPVTIRNRVRNLVEVLALSDFKIKRGAGAKPVVIENPPQWVRRQQRYNQKRS